MPIHESYAGRLATEPTLTTTKNGLQVAEAIVMVNDRTKKDGEWVDAVPSRRKIKAWRGLAGPLAGLAKGTQIVVVGHVVTERWTDTEGQTHYLEATVVDHLGVALVPPRKDT